VNESTSSSLQSSIEKDIKRSWEANPNAFIELKDARIFITGFFGCWLLQSILWANKNLNTNISATILTRDPDAFLKSRPYFSSHKDLQFIKGDVRSFDNFDSLDNNETFTHLIHAATPASAQIDTDSPQLMFNTIVAGTRNVLDFALKYGVRRVLFTSSGAVYGKQPSDLEFMNEDFIGTPNLLQSSSAYEEGKRVAELLCSNFGKTHNIEIVIGRFYAFVGPYLPLDQHFAIGNFIKDAVERRPLIIKGDGTPYRSYLYGSDMVLWLWTLLGQGKAMRAYNVGSDQALNIRSLAEKVSTVVSKTLDSSKSPVEVQKIPTVGISPERYVPSIERAQKELGVKESISLDEAIQRTAIWAISSRK
jgi:nucleoside-diphosphate-sugar epimerase